MPENGICVHFAVLALRIEFIYDVRHHSSGSYESIMVVDTQGFKNFQFFVVISFFFTSHTRFKCYNFIEKHVYSVLLSKKVLVVLSVLSLSSSPYPIWA